MAKYAPAHGSTRCQDDRVLRRADQAQEVATQVF